MLEVTQLRAGTVFEDTQISSGPWVVMKYEHVKTGRGSATIKVKIKNLKNGTIIIHSFTNGSRVQDIILEKRKGQFLYNDGSNYVFMDPLSFEQFEVPGELLTEQGQFLQEGTEVDLKFFEGKPLSIVLPLKMTFTVTETDPGVKGNTVSNVFKEATIDTGARVKVPLFVEVGAKIVVNTETGEYSERAK